MSTNAEPDLFVATSTTKATEDNTLETSDFGDFSSSTSGAAPITKPTSFSNTTTEITPDPFLSSPSPPSSEEHQEQPQHNMNVNVNQQPMSSDVSDRSLFGVVKRTFCSLDGLRQHFDVNTVDVQQRILGSLQNFHVQNGWKEKILNGGKPDAYGPFWIATTLVFFVAVTSNISAYLHSTDEDDFEYDVTHLARAMVVLYAFSFGLPLAFFVVFRCLSINLSLMDLVSLYGYGLVPYLPATALCIIPMPFLEWLFLLVATGISGVFVLKNMIVPVAASGGNTSASVHSKVAPILGPVIGCHVIFLLVLKLGFYHHTKK